MESKSGKKPYSVELASSLFALALIIGFLYVTQSVIVPLLFAIILSMTLYPIASFFENKLRFGKAAASIMAVIIAILIISTLIWFIVHQSIIIGKDAVAIQEKVLAAVESIQNWIQSQFGLERSEVIQKMKEQGNNALENVGGYQTFVECQLAFI